MFIDGPICAGALTADTPAAHMTVAISVARPNTPAYWHAWSARTRQRRDQILGKVVAICATSRV
jgi:hypothetical protein